MGDDNLGTLRKAALICIVMWLGGLGLFIGSAMGGMHPLLILSAIPIMAVGFLGLGVCGFVYMIQRLRR